MILVGTNDGFQAVPADLPRMPAGHSMSHVMRANGELWAISDSRVVWHDPGVGQGQPVATLSDRRANCLGVVGDQILVGGSEATLFVLSDGALRPVEGFDRAPGRDQWHTPWGGPPDVRSIATGPDGSLYVNVHVGGVVRSTAGESSWQPTLDIDADVHEVIADPATPGTVYVAAAVGLGVSTDGGDTWAFSHDGMHGSYCRAVALSNRFVIVSASLGSGGRRAALYRRPRDGGRFERCRDGLPEWFSTNLDTFCLQASGELVVAGDADGTVYVSADEGETWETAASALPGVNCVALV